MNDKILLPSEIDLELKRAFIIETINRMCSIDRISFVNNNVEKHFRFRQKLDNIDEQIRENKHKPFTDAIRICEEKQNELSNVYFNIYFGVGIEKAADYVNSTSQLFLLADRFYMGNYILERVIKRLEKAGKYE